MTVSDLGPGATFGVGRHCYEVVSEIGRGGVGIVYRVIRRATGEHLAAKVLSSHRFPLTEGLLERFRREARLLRLVKHRNLLRVRDVISSRDRLFIVSELATGGSLYERLRAGQRMIPLETVIDWMWQSLQGVAALHRLKIVHRDLTPKNILFKGDTLVIGDFGTARSLDDTTITHAADHLGSLVYISAQQRADPHQADLRDDMFSLGQVYYEIAAGVPPHGNPPSLARVRKDVWPGLARFIDSLRSFELEERPTDAASAAALLLDAVFGDRVNARPFVDLPFHLVVSAEQKPGLEWASLRQLAASGLLFACPEGGSARQRIGSVGGPLLARLLDHDDPGYLREARQRAPLRRRAASIVRRVDADFARLAYPMRTKMVTEYLARLPEEDRVRRREVAGEHLWAVLFRRDATGWYAWIGRVGALALACMKTLIFVDPDSKVVGGFAMPPAVSFVVDRSLISWFQLCWGEEIRFETCGAVETSWMSQLRAEGEAKGLVSELIQLVTEGRAAETWVSLDSGAIDALMEELRHLYAEIDHEDRVQRVMGD